MTGQALHLATGLLMGVTSFGSLVLYADRILLRRSKRAIWLRGRGCRITYSVGGRSVNNPAVQQPMIAGRSWWKSCLPWPGKRKWAETVLTKVALLGATLEYQAVSAWDWDEAWVIVVDADTIIASPNKVATALAYLKHMGVPEAVKEIDLWLAGWSRKPPYAIIVKPKLPGEVTNGSSPQEGSGLL